jgi:hypothetical protein
MCNVRLPENDLKRFKNVEILDFIFESVYFIPYVFVGVIYSIDNIFALLSVHIHLISRQKLQIMEEEFCVSYCNSAKGQTFRTMSVTFPITTA